MKASITNARHAPRKMRLVANLIKGKSVNDAVSLLSIAPKRAAAPLLKLLMSAVANAKNQGKTVENFVIRECSVNKGIVFKRFMPVARGAANQILKRTSHIKLELGEAVAKKSKGTAKKKEVKE